MDLEDKHIDLIKRGGSRLKVYSCVLLVSLFVSHCQDSKSIIGMENIYIAEAQKDYKNKCIQINKIECTKKQYNKNRNGVYSVVGLIKLLKANSVPLSVSA